MTSVATPTMTARVADKVSTMSVISYLVSATTPTPTVCRFHQAVQFLAGKVRNMLEFTSVSVSSYEASNLSDELQRLSGEGWTVVSIVNAGSDIVAYLSRQASGAPQEHAAAPAEQPAQEGGVG